MITSSSAAAAAAGDASEDDVGDRSVAELVAPLRSAFSVVTFDEVQKVLEAVRRRSDREVERLRRENRSFRDEFVRLNLVNIRLAGELWNSGSGGDDECEVAGTAEDVYNVLKDKVGRGGGGGGGEEEEKSLKEMVVEMRRKNEELEGEKRELEGKKRELQSQLRVWEGKYKELDQRVLQLERDTSMLKDEGQCVLGNGEGESVVQREPDGLVNGVGDRGSTQRGSDSKGGGGSVSLGCSARRKVDFGTGSCLSPLAGSNSKSPVIKDGVLGALPGDGSTPIVEIIESDDDGGGPSEKLAGDIYHGRRNDEKGNKELKRKRGSFSSVFDEPLTQTLRGIATALKQCGQKKIKEKDSDNSFIKLAGVNTIKHENGDGSASAKSDDGSSLQNERWKYKANMLDDITEDDELCIKAVCALHRWQRSKLMEWSTRQGFDGLLSPKENDLAKFLTGGDPEGKLKKSVMDLRDHSPEGLTACRNIVTKHFEQLFIMYQKKGDPFFPSS